MPEYLPGRCHAGATRRASWNGSSPRCLPIACLALLSTTTAALAQQLPPGGTTSWEIQQPEEIVTFVLFDPKAPGVSLPAGLRLVLARAYSGAS